MKKRDVGMANASLKGMETRKSFQVAIQIKVICQDACQHLMLHAYITASRTIVNILLS